MRAQAPTIAVSSGFTDYGDYLGLALSRPLVAAGATPVVLPFLEDADARRRALELADGVVLGFGRDLDPASYGASWHPAMTEVSPHRDAFERELALEALDAGLPVLGICRGMQVLNVALGGTLYRDRAEYPEAARDHPGGDWDTWDLVCEAELGRRPMPEHPSHPVEVRAGSRLHAALGDRAEVNSYHHQAVCDLGDGVDAVAWAPDGIVEAIELPGTGTLALGVQWELQQAWRDDERFLDVFRALVSEAGRRARSSAGRPRAAAPGAPRAAAAR